MIKTDVEIWKQYIFFICITCASSYGIINHILAVDLPPTIGGSSSEQLGHVSIVIPSGSWADVLALYISEKFKIQIERHTLFRAARSVMLCAPSIPW